MCIRDECLQRFLTDGTGILSQNLYVNGAIKRVKHDLRTACVYFEITVYGTTDTI